MGAKWPIPPVEVSLRHFVNTGAAILRFESVIREADNDTLKSDLSPLLERRYDAMTL